MAMIDKLNVIQILKERLEYEVKQTIIQELTRKYMRLFEEELRECLVKKLEQVSFDKIESFKDYSDLREEFNVHITVAQR